MSSSFDSPSQPLYYSSRSPDTASVKLKVIYASSKEALQMAHTGIAGKIQATYSGDLDIDKIKRNLNDTQRPT